MALASSSSCQTAAVTVLWSGRARTLKLNRWAALALLALVPLLATWYLAATLYLVFHDQLLASLMNRQADMQYAYEDRIAALKTALDRETSRGMIDRHSLGTAVRDLTARGERLEARAATIEALVAKGLRDPLPTHDTPGPARAVVTFTDNPLLTSNRSAAAPSDRGAYGSSRPSAATPDSSLPSPDLRRDESRLRDGDIDRAGPDGSMQPGGKAVADLFARIETEQAQTLARLRDPMVQSVERLETALAETGLPSSRWDSRGRDVGGPFVPLPADASGSSFEQNLALLQDAVLQHERLSALVDRVPLRKPLEGPLEVTSTFGPRMDPFYGRPALHTGLDLHESAGEMVEATAAGTVTIAGSEGGYGNMVEVDHGDGLATRYAHLSAIDVGVHQKVKAGDVVGRVGSTGRATGPHLHYETRINGEAVDPARFLRAGATLFPG